jgi:SNF2 family DNA or RNA helicase
VKPDAAGAAVGLGEPYPSADAALEIVRQNAGKVIVWCQHVADVDLMSRTLAAANVRHVTCDGRTPQGDRPGLRRVFAEDPSVKVWLGTLATGGVGVDLGGADLMLFYSHGYDLVKRLQGLERNYGSSQQATRVDVVDLVAADTVDERALAALERKEDLAARLTGARLRELIE